MELLKKLLSGRYFLTIVGGLVFGYCAVKGLLEAQAVASILSMIFISYFQKNNNKDGVA